MKIALKSYIDEIDKIIIKILLIILIKSDRFPLSTNKEDEGNM